MPAKLYLRIAKDFRELKAKRNLLGDIQYEKELDLLLLELKNGLAQPNITAKQAAQLKNLLQLVKPS